MSHNQKCKLNAKQQVFVQEYLVDLNATQAAIRAGYSYQTARQQATRLLSNVYIQEVLEMAKKERQERTRISQDQVLKDISTVIDRCMQSEPVKDRSGRHVLVENLDGEMVPAYIFNSNGALRGCELIGKHLGLFTTKHEITGKDGGPIEVMNSVIDRIWRENEEEKIKE
ncbi:MAG: terminase small subunit [Pseudodesulfovibrio sp.]|nr:terminase small subunit [Pseudodesulfovibrio sp.]